MKCPNDTVALENIPYEHHTLEVCPTCQGIWFDYDELRTLVRELSIGAVKILNEWERRPLTTEPLKNHWYEPVRICPKDGREMRRLTFAGNSKIHVDQCEQCKGFWFDGDDVTRLVAFTKPNEFENLFVSHVATQTREAVELERLVDSMQLKTPHPPTANPFFYLVLLIFGIIVEQFSNDRSSRR